MQGVQPPRASLSISRNSVIVPALSISQDVFRAKGLLCLQMPQELYRNYVVTNWSHYPSKAVGGWGGPLGEITIKRPWQSSTQAIYNLNPRRDLTDAAKPESRLQAIRISRLSGLGVGLEVRRCWRSYLEHFHTKSFLLRLCILG